eukprot:8299958-Karenia_brevis.AAC.1
MSAARPKEARHNRQGYAKGVGRILNQQEGYRLADHWARGTPEAPMMYHKIQQIVESDMGEPIDDTMVGAAIH